MDVIRASWGVFSVANATMMRALRAVSIERGFDPRSCDLVAFGGAGPVHAAALAESLGIQRVFVPMLAGVFSALGLLLAEVRHDFNIGLGGRIDDVDGHRVVQAFADTEVQARAALIQSCGGAPPGFNIERFAAVRYAYQIGEILVPLEIERPESFAYSVRQRFIEAHVKEFGFSRPDAPIELQNLRLSITSVGLAADFRSVIGDVPTASSGTSVTRVAYFGPSIGVEAPVISRADLASGLRPLSGPLLIEEDDTTIVVPPGWVASCDKSDWIVSMERFD
jgi:N-methylhydantoinase A